MRVEKIYAKNPNSADALDTEFATSGGFFSRRRVQMAVEELNERLCAGISMGKGVYFEVGVKLAPAAGGGKTEKKSEFPSKKTLERCKKQVGMIDCNFGSNLLVTYVVTYLFSFYIVLLLFFYFWGGC